MAGNNKDTELGELVKQMITAVHAEGQKQGRYRIHPLIYANLVVIAGLIFSTGIAYQKINELEKKNESTQSLQQVAPRVEAMQQEVSQLQQEVIRFRERFDRFLDQQRNSK
jgi:FtsZ-binding cell division protein ZapB